MHYSKIGSKMHWLPSGLPTSEMPTGRQSWGRQFWVHHSSGLPTLIIRWFVSTLVEWNNILKVLKYQPDPSPKILHSLTVNDSLLLRFFLWLDCSDTVVQSRVGSCVKNLTGHQLTGHQLMMIWWWSSFGHTLYYLFFIFWQLSIHKSSRAEEVYEEGIKIV